MYGLCCTHFVVVKPTFNGLSLPNILAYNLLYLALISKEYIYRLFAILFRI